MKPTKIVVIGAGSASFGLNSLATLVRSERLRGSALSLVDINASGLATITQLAHRLNREWGAQLTIESATDATQGLDGAEFVILSLEVTPREALWRLDWEIPIKHGLRQPYGENGGPGGFAHAARNMPPIMQIVRQMEAQCPDAWLIVFSNPLPRLCRAITRYSKIKTVGLCHQLLRAYVMAGWVLADVLDIEAPANLSMKPSLSASATRRKISAQAIHKLDIKAAGLNHFTWILAMHDAKTGEDLYPLFKERLSLQSEGVKGLRKFPTDVQPLSRELMDIFGLFPVAGDDHLAEYLPWVHEPQGKPWARYGIQLWDWAEAEASREAMWGQMERMIAGQDAIVQLKEVHSEGAVEVIESIAGNLNSYLLAVNLPNEGYITNLPQGAIVEVPAIASAYGVRGLSMGALPEPIAELCRREIALVDLVTEAAVTGNRQVALQALLLDPMVNDIEMARRILDDYLTTHAPYLPQFQ
jgi:alpha-galactosidase